jgi:hypothetical protein
MACALAPIGRKLGAPNTRSRIMVICPVAIAVGCKKCPAFSVCPLKTTLGDYKAPPPATKPPAKDR